MYINKRKCVGSITFLILSVQTLLVSGNKCPPAESIMPCRCRGRNEQVQVWYDLAFIKIEQTFDVNLKPQKLIT